MSIEEQLKRDVIRLAKDQERIRISYDTIDCLESMIFFRGGDNAPRIRILKLLQSMNKQVKDELEIVDTLTDENEYNEKILL